MKHIFFITITVNVGYNCIKTLEYLTAQNLVEKMICIHSNSTDNFIVIDFHTNYTTEQEIIMLQETLENKIKLLTYKQIK